METEDGVIPRLLWCAIGETQGVPQLYFGEIRNFPRTKAAAAKIRIDTTHVLEVGGIYDLLTELFETHDIDVSSHGITDEEDDPLVAQLAPTVKAVAPLSYGVVRYEDGGWKLTFDTP